MANQRKIIGRIPVYRGEWTIDNSPYHKLNDVTLYGCTFRSKIESNSYPPATIGSNGELVVNENWSLISSGYESEKINEDIAFIDKNSSAYNVSRFHIHSGFWEAIEYDESQEAYMEAKEYASGSKVNLVNYTNYTFVAKKAMTGIQPDINNITNKFTLEEAVLFVPNKYQLSGLDIGFISSDTNKPVFHRYNGGLFTSILNWTEDVYEKLTELEQNTDTKITEISTQLGGMINETVDNPIYIHSFVDSQGIFLFGIKKDGSIEWAKGVPSPVRDYIINALKKQFSELHEYEDNLLFESVTVDKTGKILDYNPHRKIDREEKNLFKTVIPTRISVTEPFTCSAYIDDENYVYVGHTDKITKYLAKEYKRIEKKGELEINKTGTSQYVRSIVGRGNNIFVSLRGNGFGYWVDDTTKAEFRALWDDKDVMSRVFTNYSHSETSSITYVDNVDSPGRGMGSCKLSGIGDCYIYTDKDITKGDITLFLKYSGASDCHFPILKNGDDNVLGIVVSGNKLGIKVNNQDYISDIYTLSDNWINVKITIATDSVDLFVRSKECQNGSWSKISTANVTMNASNKIGIGLSSTEYITAYVDDIEYNPTDIEIVSYNAGRIVIVNKNDMSLVKSYDINIRVHGMIIDGDILYAALNGGMNVYRISSDNNSLTLLCAFRYSDLHYSNELWATEMQNLAVFSVSNKKYVAATCYTHGVTIMDVTDPFSITQVIRYNDILKIWGSGGLYHEWDIYVQYPYIFTSMGSSHVVVNQGASVPAGKRMITGIKVRDISDIMSPVVKLISAPEAVNPYPVTKDPLPISLTKIGQYLFLGYGDKGIGVFEIDGMNTIYKNNLLPNYQSNSTFLSKGNGYLYIADSSKIFEDYSINLSTLKIESI